MLRLEATRLHVVLAPLSLDEASLAVSAAFWNLASILWNVTTLIAAIDATGEGPN